jgi:outer membrane protein assembly factor BamB
VLAGIVGAMALVFWHTQPSTLSIAVSVPGMDGRPVDLPLKDNVRIGTIFIPGTGKPSSLPGTWPRFRGQDFSNIVSAPSAQLAETWPTNGPKSLWTVETGEGCAAPIVSKGCVYLLDYDETARADVLRCLSLDDGQELWRRGYGVQIKRNHGMSRTVPAVSEPYVVTIGPRGHVMCTETGTGRFLWGIDMERRFGTKIPDWYTGQCPLIDGDTVVLAPAGTNTFMLGVELATGKTVWETSSEGRWKMSHSSVVPAVIAGRRMFVYAAVGCLAGVAADGPDRGKLLWQTPEWRANVIAPSPVVLTDNRLFVTAGYGAGSMLFQISREGDTFTVTTIKKYNTRSGLACEQHTPIFHQNRLFAVLPKDAGANKNTFACADTEGTILWTSGDEVRFGIGPFIVVGDRFLILDDEGVLTMARVSTERFIPMARAKVLPGHDSWGPLAVVGTRLLLRDFKHLMCVDLGEQKGNP